MYINKDNKFEYRIIIMIHVENQRIVLQTMGMVNTIWLVEN